MKPGDSMEFTRNLNFSGKSCESIKNQSKNDIERSNSIKNKNHAISFKKALQCFKKSIKFLYSNELNLDIFGFIFSIGLIRLKLNQKTTKIDYNIAIFYVFV